MGRVIACLMAVLWLSAAALGDGKVFRYGVAEMPPIPDQQALICYDQQTQTQRLAIETRFKVADGPSPGYAWVVPLPGPSAPTITPATTGLFPTLRQVFQPRVVRMRGPELVWLCLFTSLAIVVLVQMSGRKIELIGILLAGICLFICAGVLLPTLGTARSSMGGASADVAVLDRSVVGDYEVTTIAATPEAADAAKSLGAWLEANGFKQPLSVGPVLADYAKRGWVFACVKLVSVGTPSADGTLTPHPLVFTFKTAEAVYPMALTGVGNGPLSLDLYVFGSGTAQAPGLRVERSSEARPPADGRYMHRSPFYRADGNILVAHPVLRELAGALPVATKLSRTLTAEQQAGDVAITIGGFAPTGAEKYTRASAVYAALDLGGGVLVIGVIVLVAVTAAKKQDAQWFNRRLAMVLLPAVVVGMARWVMLPTVETTSFSRRDAYRQIEDLQTLGAKLSSRFLYDTEAPNLNEVRRAVVEVLKETRGTPPREEDSPWNYTLATNASGGVVFTFYDGIGQANTFDIWVKPKQTDAKP